MASNNGPEPNLQVVGKFPSAQDAMAANRLLENQGIKGRLQRGEVPAELKQPGLFASAVTKTGIYLAVPPQDAEEALAILRDIRDREMRAEHGADDEWDDDLPVYGEGGYAEDEEEEEFSTSPHVHPELIRAYRAAIIGLFILPPLLNFYSLWIIVRNRLWREENWRFPVTIIINILGGLVGGMVLRAFGFPGILF